MDFVKRSYESLVYIRLEPVLLYRPKSDLWLSRSVKFSWDISWDLGSSQCFTSSSTNPDIVWNLKEGNPFEVEKDPYNIQEVD